VVIDYICNVPEIRHVLIACPKSVVDAWPVQFDRHAAIRCHVVPLREGTIAQRTRKANIALAQADALNEPGVLIINLEAAWQGDFGKWALAQSWDMVVCDEIHRIKSPSGQCSKYMQKLGARSKRRVGLTGTPMPHTPWDVYAQFRFLDVGVFGQSYIAFKSRYPVVEQTRIEMVDDVVLLFGAFQLAEKFKRIPISGRRWNGHAWQYSLTPENASVLLMSLTGLQVNLSEEFAEYCRRHGLEKQLGYVARIDVDLIMRDLNEKFYSIAHRVKKSDVLDLPPVVHERRLVELSPAARAVYDEVEDQFIADVAGGVITASNALARLLRLQQITCGFGVTEEGAVVELDTAKRMAMREDLDDISPTEPVVVFCRFQHDLDVIRAEAIAAGRPCMELSGRKTDKYAWFDKSGTAVCLQELLAASGIADFANAQAFIQSRGITLRTDTVGGLHDWQCAGGGEVLAVQIQAGGVGVDLTRSCYCIDYSLNFSLGDYLQHLARTDRPGQTRSVTYLHYVAVGTVDEKVYTALENREEVVEAVLAQTAAIPSP